MRYRDVTNVTYYKTMNLSGQLLQLGSYNCHHTIIIPPQQHAVRKNNVGVVWFVLVIMVAHLRRKKKNEIHYFTHFTLRLLSHNVGRYL